MYRFIVVFLHQSEYLRIVVLQIQPQMGLQ